MGLRLFSKFRFPGDYGFDCNNCGQQTKVTLHENQTLDVYCSNPNCGEYIKQIVCDTLCDINVDSVKMNSRKMLAKRSPFYEGLPKKVLLNSTSARTGEIITQS